MAVPSLNSLGAPALPLSGEPLANARKNDISTVGKSDETRLSSAASVLTGAADAADATLVNASKVSEIRQRIADGSYLPNARVIADKLLQEAWLTRQD